MTREIKFRQFSQKIEVAGTMLAPYFNYWGYIDGRFKMPLSGSNMKPSQQYTGLKDKNGKEIYEGDILEHYGKIWCVQQLENGWFAIDQIGRTPAPDGGYFDSDSDLLGNQYNVCEVIGNIYENKELLND